MTVEHFTPDDLRAFSAAVFASAGLPQDHADIIARDLIKANLRGLEAVTELDVSGVFARPSSTPEAHKRRARDGVLRCPVEFPPEYRYFFSAS